jgi:hypothetical protein
MGVQYNLLQGGFKNVSRNGQISGFQVLVKTAYYRGVALSMIEGFDVTVDGETFKREQIQFSARGTGTHSLDEMESIGDVRWPWLEPATLTINKPDGLKAGSHQVKVVVRLRISYMPFIPNVYAFQDELVLVA